MGTAELTLGDRMAAAIDRQLDPGGDREMAWGDDLSDDAFREAYAILSRRDIPFGEIERVLEGTRRVRDEIFDPFGPPHADHHIRRYWASELKGRLVGCFALCERPGEPNPDGTISGQPDRVHFDNTTWTVTVDGQDYQVGNVVMYHVWKTVFEAGLDYINEREIMARMRRKQPLTIHKKRAKLPEALNEMLEGEPGEGYCIRLPPTPDKLLRDLL